MIRFISPEMLRIYGDKLGKRQFLISAEAFG